MLHVEEVEEVDEDLTPIKNESKDLPALKESDSDCDESAEYSSAGSQTTIESCLDIEYINKEIELDNILKKEMLKVKAKESKNCSRNDSSETKQHTDVSILQVEKRIPDNISSTQKTEDKMKFHRKQINVTHCLAIE